MLGAIVGDIVGSRFEWNNLKSKDFDLFTATDHITDDSVMTLAVATALMNCDSIRLRNQLQSSTVYYMRKFGNAFPHAGYGGRFRKWLFDVTMHAYGSFGNGSAMRVSACGWVGNDLAEVKALSNDVTCITHNHPEGLKGAEATAVAVFLARSGASKEEIKNHLEAKYYKLDFTLDEIRDSYSFDGSCQGTVPQALEAFLEATDFEDAIRNAISIGGDSDTLAAITGAVAEAYFGLPPIFRQKAYEYLWEADRCHSTNGLLTYSAQIFEKNYYLRTFLPREQMPVF